MKHTNDISPIDDVARIASKQLGSGYYLAAVIFAILLFALTAPVCMKRPMLTLTVLAASTAVLGVLSFAFHSLLVDLLSSVVPLQREAGHLRATLKVTENKLKDSEADRDRWKSAVERAAGGPAGATPAELIARQALRIRTLERALGHDPDVDPEGGVKDAS